MSISYEPIYNELEKLLIETLPEYIEKINIRHNDHIIIKPFENKSIEENCEKTPSFKLISYKKSCSEKDRIIGLDEFYVRFEVKLKEYETYRNRRFWRYMEAIQLMLIEAETKYSYYFCDEEWFTFCIMVTVEF